MKKYFSLLLICLLFACSSKTNDVIEDNIKDEFIEPTNEVEVFDYLNEETKNILYKANGDKVIETNILELFGKELINYELTDYYGNTFNLQDYAEGKLIIELAANWCTHCMEQSKTYNEVLKAAYPDINIIQYFNNGDKEEIEAFYQEIGSDLPTDIIVISEDKDFSNALLSQYNPQYYPSFLIFNDGILTFVSIAQLTTSDMENIYDVAFKGVVQASDLVDDNGNSIFVYHRSEEDVKNDLSELNYQKLSQLDNDEYTLKNTLKYIGSDINYLDQLEDDSYFESEVDFTDYQESDVVIVYYSDLTDESIQMLNDFTDIHSELSVIVLDVNDENVDNLKELLTAKVCSIMNQIPSKLNDITFNAYPSCIFVSKGIITGAYSNIINLQKLDEATELFLGENSIALKKNN